MIFNNIIDKFKQVLMNNIISLIEYTNTYANNYLSRTTHLIHLTLMVHRADGLCSRRHTEEQRSCLAATIHSHFVLALQNNGCTLHLIMRISL